MPKERLLGKSHLRNQIYLHRTKPKLLFSYSIRLGQMNNSNLLIRRFRANWQNSNFNVIYWKHQCSNFSSNLISDFEKMLICATVFLKMKRECTLVQGKCNKMVTSAMPPFHHSKNKNSKNSINFFSQLQYKLKLCDLICDHYYVYPLTGRSQNSAQLLATDSQLWCFRAEVSKLRPAGQIRPAKTFCQ